MKKDKTENVRVALSFAVVALACALGSCTGAPQLAVEEALSGSPIRYASSPKEIYAVAHNGFIPNSVLTAAGWPANKLPANGLQVAKRGNRVLPSGMAESDDPAMQWKTSPTFTSGSAVMTSAEYPAIQYCRDMGEGWFLPSRDELRLIYANHSTLGAFYSFRAKFYWSATDAPFGSSRLVNFSTGSTLDLFKAEIFRVRCVKLI